MSTYGIPVDPRYPIAEHESDDPANQHVNTKKIIAALLDEHYCILALSDGAASTLGHNPSVLIGENWNLVAASLQQSASPRQSSSLPLEQLLINGHFLPIRYIPLQTITRPAILALVNADSPNGNVEMDAVRGQLETQALRQLVERGESGSLSAAFISQMSHQMRTPLGIILSAAGILERYGKSLTPEQNQEYLVSIMDTIQNMTSFLEDIVWLSKFRTYSLSFNPQKKNLSHFCHNLIEESRAAAAKTVSIVFSHESIPPEVSFDPLLLRLAISHLLSNAIKFSNGNEPIHLKMQREGLECLITIRDCGIGIPEKDQPHIFEPFFRGGNIGEIAGNGLGLSLVQHCVALHSGTMSFESVPEESTTFRITLPLFDPDESSQNEP